MSFKLSHRIGLLVVCTLLIVSILEGLHLSSAREVILQERRAAIASQVETALSIVKSLASEVIPD